MSAQEMTDTLISASDRLCDSLKVHDTEGYAEEIFNRIDPSVLEDGAFLILDNAPCFLDSTFYPALDGLLNAESLDSLMQANADLLAEDASGMWYDIVCKDPQGVFNFLPAGTDELHQHGLDIIPGQLNITGYLTSDTNN